MNRIIGILILVLIFSANSFSKEYTVKRGDTLWDISGSFYNNYFLWPVIWKYNVTINNPDLIYPNQKINIPIIEGNFDKLQSKEMVLHGKSRIMVNNKGGEKNKNEQIVKTLILNDYELVMKGLPGCKIVNMEGDHYYGSNGDLIYVKGRGLNRGEKIALLREEKVMDDLYVLKVIGYATVKGSSGENSFIALIEKSFEPIEVGGFCTTGLKEKIQYSKKYKDVFNLTGGKIIFLSDNTAYSSSGNRIVVFEENSSAKVGDIYDIVEKKVYENFEKVEKKGEALVIYKNGDYLTMLVIKSDREIEVGDYAVLSKVSLN